MDIRLGRIFSAYFSRRQFWFRIFGRGLRFSNRNLCPPTFSERQGLKKVLRIGRWSIAWLPPLPKYITAVDWATNEPSIQCIAVYEKTDDGFQCVYDGLLEDYHKSFEPLSLPQELLEGDHGNLQQAKLIDEVYRHGR